MLPPQTPSFSSPFSHNRREVVLPFASEVVSSRLPGKRLPITETDEHSLHACRVGVSRGATSSPGGVPGFESGGAGHAHTVWTRVVVEPPVHVFAASSSLSAQLGVRPKMDDERTTTLVMTAAVVEREST
ncbi:hypothetical protein MRX96_021421 [Rhipicephalus microplus]